MGPGRNEGPEPMGPTPRFEVLLLVLSFAVQPLGRQQPASHSMTSGSVIVSEIR